MINRNFWLGIALGAGLVLVGGFFVLGIFLAPWVISIYPMGDPPDHYPGPVFETCFENDEGELECGECEMLDGCHESGPVPVQIELRETERNKAWCDGYLAALERVEYLVPDEDLELEFCKAGL